MTDTIVRVRRLGIIGCVADMSLRSQRFRRMGCSR